MRKIKSEKDVEFIKVDPSWIPIIEKIRNDLDWEPNFYDKEKAVILLIAAGYFLNKEYVPQKVASRLMSLCRKTVLASFFR